jgi:hypothetical protein
VGSQLIISLGTKLFKLLLLETFKLSSKDESEYSGRVGFEGSDIVRRASRVTTWKPS